MFHSARIKLTAWYLLIIMLVSVSFSAAMYRTLTLELDRIERVQRLRIEHRLPERRGELPRFLDPDIISETKDRLVGILAIVNLAILGTSALAGYFLAGRTLRPIKDMIDEQSRFIADASHELRTPITSLKSEIEVNLRDKTLTIKEAKKLLTSNLEEVNNLQTLSDGLLKLSQYQKGGNGLITAKVSLHWVITKAIKRIERLAKSKHIFISDKTTDEIIAGNKPALVELFVIFLDNAVKYSPKKTTVLLTSERSDGHVLIHIADQGFGIDEKDIPHLFGRFYRTDKSRTKSHVPGYGLGLSIARQITDRHHGFIRVKSKPNEGTTFTIGL